MTTPGKFVVDTRKKERIFQTGTLVSLTGEDNSQVFFTVLETWRIPLKPQHLGPGYLGLAWCHQRNARVTLALYCEQWLPPGEVGNLWRLVISPERNDSELVMILAETPFPVRDVLSTGGSL